MAMNLAFVFPFVLLAWGPEALARTVIFDIGNAVTQWTLVYFVAARYGGGVAHVGRGVAARRAGAPVCRDPRSDRGQSARAACVALDL